MVKLLISIVLSTLCATFGSAFMLIDEALDSDVEYAQGASCPLEHDINYSGILVDNSMVEKDTAEECCAHCANYVDGCAGFSYAVSSRRCWFRSSITGSKAQAGVISGTLELTPTTTAAPATTSTEQPTTETPVEWFEGSYGLYRNFGKVAKTITESRAFCANHDANLPVFDGPGMYFDTLLVGLIINIEYFPVDMAYQNGGWMTTCKNRTSLIDVPFTPAQASHDYPSPFNWYMHNFLDCFAIHRYEEKITPSACDTDWNHDTVCMKPFEDICAPAS